MSQRGSILELTLNLDNRSYEGTIILAPERDAVVGLENGIESVSKRCNAEDVIDWFVREEEVVCDDSSKFGQLKLKLNVPVVVQEWSKR